MLHDDDWRIYIAFYSHGTEFIRTEFRLLESNGTLAL